ncbi:MAG: phospho-sugar mutase [Oscillospiraceae bacterium]|nr:phospho-sugar mutase [Oscillospiraceae bacterium]
MHYRAEYEKWLSHTSGELQAELKAMSETEKEDAFYRNLAFGTGGLRGIIGAGTNRMNVFTVARASQGLADYLLKHDPAPSVVIGFDSRLKSNVFAEEASAVFAANGIRVWAWDRLLPVPTLSYAVRALHASAGVMITASHNPSRYNGYKVYGADGCQITTEAAAEILAEIEKVDLFSGVKRMERRDAERRKIIRFIPEEVLSAFIKEVKGQSVLFGDEIDRDVAIVYSPLNGTGLEPVTRVLTESGFSNITVVEEQRNPDGNFPTCPYPNPEIREAMELGLRYCKRTGADLLLATDPDCDRCGIAVRDGEDYRLLTGNEVGLLLLDFICSQRRKHGRMPERPVFVKTVVTMDLAEKIAEHYGVETVNVLTGFKFIGEVIGRLEAAGREKDYICGFEESYGYLTGAYVRDKDGVDAAFMISEMFAYYRTRGVSLPEKLEELYRSYGYCRNTLHSYEFPGSSGMEKMQAIMQAFHGGLEAVGGMSVVKTEDYLPGLNGLPTSDVLKFFFDGGEERGSVVVRPSGTEPKLKTYISVTAADRPAAEAAESRIRVDLEKLLA